MGMGMGIRDGGMDGKGKDVVVDKVVSRFLVDRCWGSIGWPLSLYTAYLDEDISGLYIKVGLCIPYMPRSNYQGTATTDV